MVDFWVWGEDLWGLVETLRVGGGEEGEAKEEEENGENEENG